MKIYLNFWKLHVSSPKKVSEETQRHIDLSEKKQKKKISSDFSKNL